MSIITIHQMQSIDMAKHNNFAALPQNRQTAPVCTMEVSSAQDVHVYNMAVMHGVTVIGPEKL